MIWFSYNKKCFITKKKKNSCHIISLQITPTLVILKIITKIKICNNNTTSAGPWWFPLDI